MNKETRRDLFNKDCEALREKCNELTNDMEAYMSNELDDETIQDLKVHTLEALFVIQKMISEVDSTYGLLDSDEPQATKDHANLVEYLLGALETLEEIFNK